MVFGHGGFGECVGELVDGRSHTVELMDGDLEAVRVADGVVGTGGDGLGGFFRVRGWPVPSRGRKVGGAVGLQKREGGDQGTADLAEPAVGGAEEDRLVRRRGRGVECERVHGACDMGARRHDGGGGAPVFVSGERGGGHADCLAGDHRLISGSRLGNRWVSASNIGLLRNSVAMTGRLPGLMAAWGTPWGMCRCWPGCWISSCRSPW